MRTRRSAGNVLCKHQSLKSDQVESDRGPLLHIAHDLAVEFDCLHKAIAVLLPFRSQSTRRQRRIDGSVFDVPFRARALHACCSRSGVRCIPRIWSAVHHVGFFQEFEPTLDQSPRTVQGPHFSIWMRLTDSTPRGSESSIFRRAGIT